MTICYTKLKKISHRWRNSCFITLSKIFKKIFAPPPVDDLPYRKPWVDTDYPSHKDEDQEEGVEARRLHRQ